MDIHFLPNLDFRNFCPTMDRAKFKNEFNPVYIFNKMGNEYDPLRWDRILRKLRVRLIVRGGPTFDVSGDFDPEKFKIRVFLTRPDLSNIVEIKYLIIQTVMHEFVHANQFFSHEDQYEKMITSNEEMTEDEEYLSRFGEIQAYAHCAALDVLNQRTDTMIRYNDCSDKTRKKFFRLAYRWYRIYLNSVQ